jgi:F-type H+-transporting ATPase subunit alpha
VYIPTTSTSPQRDEHDDDTHEDLLLQQRIQVLQQLSETAESDSIAKNTQVHILNSYTKLKLPQPKNTSTMTTNTANNNTIIDCFGNSLVPVDSTTPNDITTTHVFTPIPKVSEIALINAPLLTGITMVDALTPIGRGQNMLIVGERGTGRKSIALSAMRTQISHPNNKGAQCIYASTTTSLVQEDATTTNNNVLSRFQSYGIANQITFVSKRPQHQQQQLLLPQNNDNTTIDAIIDAAESVAVASSACSIADYWARNYGHDTLVVIDTIDPHQIFWDYTTQALMDIYGQEAVDLNTNNNAWILQ